MNRVETQIPKDSSEASAKFAWLTFVSLTLCGFVIAILDILKASGYVTGLGSSTASFCVVTFCFVLLMLRLRTVRGARFLGAFVTCLMSAGVLMCLFAVLEDLDFVKSGPWEERISFAKKLMVIAWFTTPPAFVAILFRIKDQMRIELEDRVAARTEELSKSNELLQREILVRVQTENELKASQKEQHALIEARSEELRNVQKRLLQNERLQALGMMATGLAHELNNTLTPVVCYSDLLLSSGKLTEEQREFAGHISRAATDAAHVVRSLQSFHNSADTRKDKAVDLNGIVQQVSELTRPIWHDQAIRNGYQVDLVQDLLPCQKVWGEESELRQVVTNLILNSYEALSGNGTITLSTRQLENTLELRVMDNGTGMSSEQRQRCFEPFCTGKTSGTGLGLSVCYGIVSSMNGTIHVESSSTQGTVMCIAFPTVIANTRVRLVGGRSHGNGRDTNFQGRLRILLVDDDDTVRESVGQMLEYLGAEVIGLSSGREAVAMSAEATFDLVLSDLGMPEFDGAQTIKALRNSGCEAMMAIVSGWSQPVIAERFLPDAAPEYTIRKPVDLEQLSALLDQVMQAPAPELA